MKGMIPAAILVALGVRTAVSAPGASPQLSLLLEGAHRQVGVTVHYDGSYRPLAFPGGDIPTDRGVCTDVIIRAYRHAGVDLQLLVHQDMSEAFSSYPRSWGLGGPDPNIDHRRVANLATFFRRRGKSLEVTLRALDYLPGDIVTWRLPSGAAHIGLVSDRERNGTRLVVHNIGAGARVEDVLFAYRITGHYRYDP